MQVYADMAELADAHGSGPCEGNFMGVRIPLSAPEALEFNSSNVFSFYGSDSRQGNRIGKEQRGMQLQQREEAVLRDIVTPLLNWYDLHARILPWRENAAPYRVWVSEIMLQQTRVEAVKPYYERFMDALPDIKALADAEEATLLKLWEGLGYYNRVRNLQKAAKIICHRYGGRFPDTYEQILDLPGIGSYTAGAIASIAFGLPEPAVDGNVLRVLARLQEDASDIGDARRKRQATEMLRRIYPRHRCGDFTQSLMELGAIVCLPNGEPLCRQCPLQNHCGAFAHDTQREFPVKGKRKSRKKEKKTILLLQREDRIAIQRRPDRGLLAGLWQFPMAEGFLTEQQLRSWLEKRNLKTERIVAAGERKHIFTHIEWQMQGYAVECLSTGDGSDLIWVTEEELKRDYSLPSAFQLFAKCWYARKKWTDG